MTFQDLPLCRSLTREAGWNQLDADWYRALSLEPYGCFVAEYNQEAVATTTTCVFNNAGWIAMVLVKKNARGLGIATKLLRHAIDYLQNRKCETIRLDATALGRPVYEKLGFRSEYEVVRFQGTANSPAKNANESISITEGSEYLDQIIALDQKLTGTSRRRLFEQIVQDGSLPIYGHVASNGQIDGYATARHGANAVQIGPVGATTNEAGLKVLDQIISDLEGKPVFIDVPELNVHCIRQVQERKFSEQRRFTRMYLGAFIADLPHLISACFGPEKG